MGKAVIWGVAAVAVVGGAYLGVAAYSGSMVRKYYDADLDKLERMLPIIKVTERKYESGLLSASATYSLRIGCDPQAAGPDGDGGAKSITITLRDNIALGPFPGFAGVGLARADTQVVLPPDAPQELRQWAAAMQPDAIRTTIGFDGAYTTHMQLPAGEIKGKDGGLHWKPVRATFSMNSAHTFMSYELELPEAALDFARDEDTGSVKLVNLRAQGNGELMGNMIWGNATSLAALDHLQITATRANVQIDLNQLKFNSSSVAADGGLLGTSASMTGALDINADGKTFKFDKIEMQESMKRIHAPTLQKIMLGFWQQAGGMCRKAAANPQQPTQDHEAAMLLGMKDLLIHNPEYSLDKIAITYEGREGTLSYSVAASGITSEDLQQPNMPSLLNKAIAKASVKVPVAWLEKIAAENKSGQQLLDMMLGNLIKAGYIAREGDFITSAALLEHGQLTLNGKPLDGSALLPPMHLQPQPQPEQEQKQEPQQEQKQEPESGGAQEN